jgi:hypothetical protein
MQQKSHGFNPLNYTHCTVMKGRWAGFNDSIANTLRIKNIGLTVHSSFIFAMIYL